MICSPNTLSILEHLNENDYVYWEIEENSVVVRRIDDAHPVITVPYTLIDSDLNEALELVDMAVKLFYAFG
jgi:hypothetical protein